MDEQTDYTTTHPAFDGRINIKDTCTMINDFTELFTVSLQTALG